MAEQEDDIDASAAPLLDHLIELRQRLIHSIIAFSIIFIFAFMIKDYILDLLLIPYQWAMSFFGGDPNNIRVQSTEVWETIFTKIKLAAFGAVVLAFPYIAFQLYSFIAPGLYKNERMAFLPFLVVAPLLFVIGGAFVYFVVAPLIIWFGLTQQTLPNAYIKIEFIVKVSSYLSFMTSMMLIFGLVFQLPLVTTLLAKAGLVTAKFLAEKRRWAIVFSFVGAAMITADFLSMFGLALPTILLYELSILLAKHFEKKPEVTEDAS